MPPMAYGPCAKVWLAWKSTDWIASRSVMGRSSTWPSDASVAAPRTRGAGVGSAVSFFISAWSAVTSDCICEYAAPGSGTRLPCASFIGFAAYGSESGETSLSVAAANARSLS